MMEDYYWVCPWLCAPVNGLTWHDQYDRSGKSLLGSNLDLAAIPGQYRLNLI